MFPDISWNILICKKKFQVKLLEFFVWDLPVSGRLICLYGIWSSFFVLYKVEVVLDQWIWKLNSPSNISSYPYYKIILKVCYLKMKQVGRKVIVHPCMIHLLWRTIINRLHCSCARLSTGTVFFLLLFNLFFNALLCIVLQSEMVVRFCCQEYSTYNRTWPLTDTAYQF